MPRRSNALQPKEILFVEKYLGEANFNARKAAELAGYKGGVRQLAVMGFRLLQKEAVKEYLRQRLSEEAMTADEVLMRIGKQARSSIGLVLDDKGRFDFERAKENNALELIKKIKQTTLINGEVITEVEMYSAHDARALLAKHHGLLVEQHEHTGKGGAPIAQKLTIEVVKTTKKEDSNEQAS